MPLPIPTNMGGGALWSIIRSVLGGALGFGTGKAMTVDLPLAVTLRDTTLALAGRQTPLEQLVLPIGLRGALTQPSVYFDDQTIANALLAAGKRELADFVNTVRSGHRPLVDGRTGLEALRVALMVKEKIAACQP